MDIYNKNKFLIRFTAILVLVNLFFLGYLWLNKKDEKNRSPEKRDIKEITAMLKEKLELTDLQEKKIIEIRENFFKKEESLSKQIKEQRDSMNLEMFNENTDTAKLNNIARRVSENEYQMELLRIEQSQTFKSICSPEQLKKFNILVKEIRDYFKPDDQANKKK